VNCRAPRQTAIERAEAIETGLAADGADAKACPAPPHPHISHPPTPARPLGARSMAPTVSRKRVGHRVGRRVRGARRLGSEGPEGKLSRSAANARGRLQASVAYYIKTMKRVLERGKVPAPLRTTLRAAAHELSGQLAVANL
jgi:hypothetical protein